MDRHHRHGRHREDAFLQPGREGPGREREHGRHRHGRQGGRLFDGGDLRLVLLALLAEHPGNGYELMKAIEERVGNGYSPSPGVIYPTLTLLEELGYTTVEEADGTRKVYAVTETGRAHLAENQDTVAAVFARMDEAAGQRDAPPLVRAMENLKTALRLRLSRGTLGPAEIDAIAAVLDTAAIAVERA
jgi:DNA-binding PadR family transcriptional regulator